jgi:hypothetical protein
MPSNENPRQFLRRKEAANYVETKFGIPCAPKTLSKYATVGGGPIFRKAGKFVLYLPADLNTWARARVSGPMRSTSAPAEPDSSKTGHDDD